MAEKSSASGFQGQKSNTKRDLGAGSGAPKAGGSGYITRSKSGRDLGSGSGKAPKDTGPALGVAKAKGGGDAKRLKADGVGGPFPSA